jgi:riboflavin biosynthesis pyrimidine reductase
VTASGNLAPDLPLFADPDNRPLILTGAGADPAAIASLDTVAEVIEVGEDGVDLNAAVRELGRRGASTVLAEGGPRLNGQLVAAGLVDEWNLTLSPHLLAGNSSRAAFGQLDEGPPQGMALKRVWADDDFLFCRWVRA